MYSSCIPRAMAAGLAGSILVSLTVYAFAAAGFPQPALSELFGGMLFEGAPERFSYEWFMMMAWHLNFGAVIFPHIYVLFVGRELPGAPWQKGLILGIALWLIAEALLMPSFGMGFFSSALPNPAVAVLAALLVHALYGIVLGAGTGEVQQAHERAVDRLAAHGGMHLHGRH